MPRGARAPSLRTARAVGILLYLYYYYYYCYYDLHYIIYIILYYIVLQDPASVRAFAASQGAAAAGGRVLLVNNAGVMGAPASQAAASGDGRRPPADGHLWPNHYGHFLLTRLLLPTMGVGSVVAVLASRAHRQGAVRFDDDGHLDEGFGGGHWYRRYARSKLCNVLFAAELRRRCEADGLRVVAISPGLVDTYLSIHITISIYLSICRGDLARPRGHGDLHGPAAAAPWAQ